MEAGGVFVDKSGADGRKGLAAFTRHTHSAIATNRLESGRSAGKHEMVVHDSGSFANLLSILDACASAISKFNCCRPVHSPVCTMTDLRQDLSEVG